MNIAHPITQLDRLRGCLFGGALGDTIGLFTEFLSAKQSRDLYGSNPVFTLAPRPTSEVQSLKINKIKWCHMDQHRARFEPSAWTDDTDQTLLILLSFLRSGGKDLDAKDFAKRLLFWVENGSRALDRPPLGIGGTVGGVVSSKGYLDDPLGKARERWERSDRNLAANGAVMRTGIVGALVFKDHAGISGYDRTFKAAIGIAGTTHADPRCLISCAIVSGLICAMMRDELSSENDIRTIVNNAITYLHTHYPDSKLPEEHRKELEDHIWVSSLAGLKLDERSSIGYTYKALGSGIWALREAIRLCPRTDSNKPIPRAKPSEIFEHLITKITIEGGDADTNCAVAGPLIGTWFGYHSLPIHWEQELKHREWLLSKADAAGSLLELDTIESENAGKLKKSVGNVIDHFGEEQGEPTTTSLENLSLISGGGGGGGGGDGVKTDFYYDWEADRDTLVDAGKGSMSKDEMDAMSMIVMEQMRERLGRTSPFSKKESDKDKCIIC